MCVVSELVDREELIYRANLKGSDSGIHCRCHIDTLNPDIPSVSLLLFGDGISGQEG